MSRKNNIKQFHSVVAGDMSQASITSAVTDIQFLDDIGIQLNFTGAPVGSFAIQISADHSVSYTNSVETAGNWIPVTLTYWNGSIFVTDTSIPTSVGSPIYVDLPLISPPYIRIVYTKVSGTGTLDAFITAKMV